MLAPKVYDTICQHPGCNAYEIGKIIGVNYRRVYGALVALEQSRSTLVCEDDYGRLFKFDIGEL